MGQGFESKDMTVIERGTVGLAVLGAVQAALFCGVVAAVLRGGAVTSVLLRIIAVVWVLVGGLFANLWSGSIERTRVRANRQGLWVGDVFIASAQIAGAYMFERKQNVFVRFSRHGLHLPVDVGVRDEAEGRCLLRALDLHGAERDDPEIGADGILLKSPARRYLHYGSVESATAPPGGARIEITLRSGERVLLPTAPDLALAMAAWITQSAAASATDTAAAEAPRLQRGGRALRGWIAALRALGAGANAAHRVAPLSSDRLWRIVESPASLPTLRAAAAIALGPRLDPGDRARLRSAAAATTAPRLRIALEAAAGSARDAEIETLLAEVEQEDPVSPSPRDRVAPGPGGA